MDCRLPARERFARRLGLVHAATPALARRFDRPQTRYPLCDRTQSVAELSKALIDSYFFDAASLAHCQNFSVAGLSFPFRATMPTENGFGSGVRCKNFIRFPKL